VRYLSSSNGIEQIWRPQDLRIARKHCIIYATGIAMMKYWKMMDSMISITVRSPRRNAGQHDRQRFTGRVTTKPLLVLQYTRVLHNLSSV
jgi:hypothetical protein